MVGWGMGPKRCLARAWRAPPTFPGRTRTRCGHRAHSGRTGTCLELSRVVGWIGFRCFLLENSVPGGGVIGEPPVFVPVSAATAGVTSKQGSSSSCSRPPTATTPGPQTRSHRSRVPDVWAEGENIPHQILDWTCRNGRGTTE